MSKAGNRPLTFDIFRKRVTAPAGESLRSPSVQGVVPAIPDWSLERHLAPCCPAEQYPFMWQTARFYWSLD